ncbi:hypothetical protein B2J93_4567 [Marssonina coronariae]|uniref:Uncharacterized protein n=1 Tax=Diplocarpon coronariae TaxID=2795749 RepID=A0A218Z1K0_9HELO|nr:hypothetical protein B2J93_4567 [Marssonina coronariae]
MGTTLPKYELSGRFTGAEGNASRWLNRLQYDFKSAGYTSPDLEMFFEAIDILFEGPAAEWLEWQPQIPRDPERDTRPQEDQPSEEALGPKDLYAENFRKTLQDGKRRGLYLAEDF